MNQEQSNPEEELIILGSGGGRFVTASQHRSTGGLILRCMGGRFQCHIDPGPGAIRDLRDHHVNPCSTQYVFLTHGHTDHNMSIPIIIEALQGESGFCNPRGTLIAPEKYLISGQLDQYYQKLLDHLIPVIENQKFSLLSGFDVITTPTLHGNVQNVGYIFNFKFQQLNNSIDSSRMVFYSIAFTSDTAYFKDYINVYQGVDILVANLLRPDSQHCRGHLSTDEFIPLLKEISPKLCVLIHFGTKMDDPQSGNHVPEQIQKIQDAVGDQTKVIGGEDGLRIPLNNYIRSSN